MHFCFCGKLMEATAYGYVCICGKRYDKSGKEICEKEVSAAMDAEKRKQYRYKYPNMNDPVVRVCEPVPESETADETFSSKPPSKKR